MGDSPSAHRCYERRVILPIFPNVGKHRIQTTKLLKNAVDGLRVHNPQANLLCTLTVFSQEFEHEIPVALEEKKRKEANTYPKGTVQTDNIPEIFEEPFLCPWDSEVPLVSLDAPTFSAIDHNSTLAGGQTKNPSEVRWPLHVPDHWKLSVFEGVRQLGGFKLILRCRHGGKRGDPSIVGRGALGRRRQERFPQRFQYSQTPKE